MLVGGLAGVLFGIVAHLTASGSPQLEWFLRNVAQPVGQVYLRLLFMLVIPLILSALSLGIAGFANLSSLGRIGFRTFVYTVVVSTIAVLIGIGLVNVLRPGDGLPPAAREAMLAGAAERASGLSSTVTAPKTGIDLLVQIVPDNPIKAAANGDMLGVMFFALMLGIGLAATRTEGARQLEAALEGLYDVTMTLIGMVLKLAPIGVLALLFTLTAQLGWEALALLGRYVLVVLLGLLIHQILVYGLAVRLLGGMNPVAFFRNITEAMLTAFSTASSNATLPTSIRVAEENLRLPPAVSRFVLTIGSTANQNGTALFEGVTVLFLAQFYGVELALGQQALVVAVCILGGIGTAGVPAGSLPVIALILGMVGIPVEGIGIILGVDRFLDMCRTTLNVTGDLAAAVVISRGEPHGIA
jgi:DAACS family dicarboxylate/amino acid:cation (Na+ or H+) symporter